MQRGWLFLILGLFLSTPRVFGEDLMEAHKSRRLDALRLDHAIELDGELTEPAWGEAQVATDFIQTEPKSGEPATERTEVRLLYDDDNLYVGVYCFDSNPLTFNDLRLDFSTRDNDVFEVVLDTFDDDRNGFLFGVNPKGARFDGQFGREGRSFNRDWNGIWHVQTQITGQGWQLEMSIPFKTLRFKSGQDRVWGINFLRRIRGKNEDSYWSPIPRPFRVTKVSLAGTLSGVNQVRQGRNLQVKPYLVAPVGRAENDDVDFTPDIGVDVKYGVSTQFTLDATINTDFSQVEADEEQINLTRFSLFFPEKREFFLENSSIFQFGLFGGGFGQGRDLIPFFSRRIGISDGEIVPIRAGTRLTGRAGPYSVGLLWMRTGEVGETLPTSFSVARVRRDLLHRSDFGAIFINKQDTSGRANRTVGFDSNFNFFNYLRLSSAVLKSSTPELEGRDSAGNVSVEWDDNLWNFEVGFLSIGENFNPEVGFVPRTGIRKSSAEVRYSPRPGERIPSVREFEPSFELEYITDQSGNLETRNLQGGFGIGFQDGSRLFVGQNFQFERLEEPFEIRSEQFIDPGDYSFNEFMASYSSDRSRMLSGEAQFASGDFFDGSRDSYRLSFRVQPNYRWRLDNSWRRNQVDLASGAFTTDLVTSRVDYAFSTRMFVNALVQYNSAAGEITSNVRYNFMYKPLSDFFLVYNERRSTSGGVIERALIAKLTYAFSF